MAGPAQGPFIGPGTIRGADAPVTSGSLCDGGRRMARRGCVGRGVGGLKDALTSRGRRRRVGGQRAPLLGMALPGHVACQRDRLPLGHRACPPAPLLCPGLQPPPHPVPGLPVPQDGASSVSGGAGPPLPPCHQPGSLQVAQPPMLTASERGQSTQTSCRWARESRPGDARSPSSQ